eukprot:3828561-Rhodomonas_salina.1
MQPMQVGCIPLNLLQLILHASCPFLGKKLPIANVVGNEVQKALLGPSALFCAGFSKPPRHRPAVGRFAGRRVEHPIQRKRYG